MTPSGAWLLVVEDEEPARRLLRAYLARRGYRVDQATSAGEAMRAWDAHKPDLILLDLGLPDLDGVEVIRRIRRDASTPIIVLSARGEERDKVAGSTRGPTTTSRNHSRSASSRHEFMPCCVVSGVPTETRPAGCGSARSSSIRRDAR
jgi:CheY-like chemotaxis protein